MKKTKKHRAYTDWIVNLAHELSLKYPKYSLAHSIKGEKSYLRFPARSATSRAIMFNYLRICGYE